MKRVFRWFLGVLLGGVAIVSVTLMVMPSPVLVEVALAGVGPMQWSVDEEGQTRIRERYEVSSPLTGRLRRIVLDPGDVVVEGETVLAVIEPTDPTLLDARARAEAGARVRAADAAVRRSEAVLERARAAYDFAETEFGRLRTAFERGAVTTQELDAAATLSRTRGEEFRAAQFGRDIALYELDLAESALVFASEDGVDDGEQMLINSPISGEVLRVFQESVAVVRPGTALVEVGDRADLEIVIDVLSADAVRVSPGDAVIIEGWGGDDALEAVVRVVEPAAFTKISALGVEEQRVNIIADFVSSPESHRALGDGYRVDAQIVVWRSDTALRVPTSAVFRDAQGWAVFVVEGGRAWVRPISVGWQNGRLTEITGGVAEGDRVIVHPNDRIADGVRVRESSAE